MNIANLVGYFDFSKKFIIDKENLSVIYKTIEVDNGYLIEDVFTENEIDFLLDEVSNNNSIPVGIDGIARNYQSGTKAHSYRSTIYDEELAYIIFSRISNILKPLENIYSCSEILVPYNINPAFRFIRYAEQGYLVPHYDFPFKKEENDLSLMSLVIYLTDNEDGQTQFIKENRINDNSDWSRRANSDEIILSVKPKRGCALLFPHNVLHQSEISFEEKIIIRTDVMFKKVI